VSSRSEAALLPTGIPDTDEEIAKLCLREACVLVLGPGGDKRTKLQALGTVLKYTKPRPEQRLAVASTSAEDLLRGAIMAGAAAAADDGVSG
jgi:hypothetical protein